LLICPASAAFTSPGRGASCLLIVKVSMGGRPFHGAVTPRHFHVAAAPPVPVIDPFFPPRYRRQT
jgi:hypothetical protein